MLPGTLEMGHQGLLLQRLCQLSLGEKDQPEAAIATERARSTGLTNGGRTTDHGGRTTGHGGRIIRQQPNKYTQ